MKITQVETFLCEAGWRPWAFIKITTDEGLVGWSDCTDAHGSPLGVLGVVEDLKQFLIGQDPREVEWLFWVIYGRTRQSVGGVTHKALGGIENALLDIKAKALGVPVFELFGGPVREEIPLYWTRCGTTRVRDFEHVGKPQMRTFEDVRKLGAEVRKSGFKALKTNIVILDEKPHIYMPGFSKSEGGPELGLTGKVATLLEKYIATLREAVGDEIDMMLDLNFNFKTGGFIKLGRMLERFNLDWLEIDSFDPVSLLQIKNSVKIPIASGENFMTARAYRPFFEKHAMDIVLIDAVWNGVLEAKKIADMAEVYEMQVATHGHHSPLGSFISANFAAITPNYKRMEIDVDVIPWQDEICTSPPEIENGVMMLPRKSGWGADINEEVLARHPWPPRV